jgi:hypothetical protein
VDNAVTGYPDKQEVLDRHRSLQNASGNLLDIHRMQEGVPRDSQLRKALDRLVADNVLMVTKPELRT